MKMIIAYVRPEAAARVVDALHQVPGLTGATLVDAEGFGRGRVTDSPSSSETIYGTARRVRVEVMVRDELEEAVVRAIYDTAHSGRRGDGKVYVTDLTRALRVSTGEQGEAAV